MAKDKEIEQEESKKMGIGKLIAKIILTFIMVPIVIGIIVYFTNDNFKYTANKYLTKAPFVGSYFERFPTKEERQEQKRDVARYFVSLDEESASDKLLIMQKDDNQLYTEIVKMMTQMDSRKTEAVLERIRQNSMKKDILTATLDQIEKDRKEEIKQKAKYYEGLSTLNIVQDIQDDLMNEWISYKEMGLVLEQINEKKATTTLRFLDEEMAYRLISNYSSIKKQKQAKDLLNQMKDKENELMNTASIYNEEKPEKLVEDIGNTQKYGIEDLAIIYRNMNMTQVAKVLCKVEDKEFKHELFEQIKVDEILENGTDTLTGDIIKAIQIYTDFDNKIDNLVKVYNKMEPQEIGTMITKLFKSKNTTQRYTFENKEDIVITDQQIAIEVLKKLKDKTVAQVLTTIDTNIASEISKKLSLP
ncbi:hypothetical protein [Inediibacterium massiliense]|uniref:hypothetical protein n=1 Tax=Inediibacterium massiliense TaxID=1658111 RepID=UPI0006B52DF2|nr:hypothetical protein [Inediibacterium massiliense]